MGSIERSLKRIVLLALAALMFGAAGSVILGQGPLTASGVIHIEETRIAAEFSGQISEIHVSEGQAVRKEQVLLVLDNRELQGQLDQARAALATAEASLALLRRPPRPEAEAALRAQLSLPQAEMQVAIWRLASAQAIRDNPQELKGRILEAETQLRLAAQAVEAAEADYKRLLYERDHAHFNSPEQRMLDLMAKAQEAGVAAARADQRAAAIMLQHLQAMQKDPVSLKAQVHKAEGEVAVAKAKVMVAQAQLNDLLAGPQPTEIALAEARVRLAQAQLRLAEAQTERLVLRAPCAGLVLEQIAHIGETVMPVATLLVIGDPSQVTLTVYVPEPRLGQVYLGQKALVTVDGLPERRFEGVVTHIADEAEFTPRNTSTKEGRQTTFFAVKVSIPNPDLTLKAGMPADAILETK